jgi:hypothetical protein
VASMKMAVFWVAAPCSLVEVYRCFRVTYCLHHQGDYSSPIALTMEAASTCETLINCQQTARRHNPEDRHLHALKLHQGIRIFIFMDIFPSLPKVALQSMCKTVREGGVFDLNLCSVHKACDWTGPKFGVTFDSSDCRLSHVAMQRRSLIVL